MPVIWAEDTAKNTVEQVSKSNERVTVMPCVGGSSATGKMPGWEWVESVKGVMRSLGGPYLDMYLDSSCIWTDLKLL